MTIAIIDTGCANLFSVQAALDRLGLAHILAGTPAKAVEADRLVLPGVGAAGPAMERLKKSGWAGALKSETRPVLGICLGMQLLFERSAEGDVDCLGLVPGRIAPLPRFAGGVLPHMGWNALDVEADADPLLDGVLPGSRVYFVHSYAAAIGEITVASCVYGTRFSAIIRSGNVMGCQFHPERSGEVGMRILKNFSRYCE